MKSQNALTQSGLLAALLTPLFLGLNPIWGKIAYNNGADPFTVAALRTIIAVILLWVIYYIFWRRYLFIYPAGLMNCIAIGFVNGIGSLMYYNGLNLLDASVAQLLNGMYLIFVLILTRIGGQRTGWRIVLRVSIAVVGVMFVTGGIHGEISWLGIGLMLGNALLFAGTVVMSQRALYDMPAQTVTFYVLATMAVVVSMARLSYGLPVFDSDTNPSMTAFWAIFALAITTSISRLLMFIGVKGLGSLQTTLLAILEMAASITLAYLFLGESFTAIQWWGVALMIGSLMLPSGKVDTTISPTAYLPNLTRIQLWEMAFTHAFIPGKDKRTSQELSMLRQMIQQDKYTTHEMRVVNEMYITALLNSLPLEADDLATPKNPAQNTDSQT